MRNILRTESVNAAGPRYFIGFVLVLALVRAEPVYAERVALVIGNAAYVEASALLTNPVRDARAMALTLDDLGFEVSVAEDADVEEMDEAVDEFIRRVRPGDTAVFYYSGHGVELDGENYLLPVDFSSSYTPARARRRSTSATEVQALMEEAGAEVRIVILDACRDNPFQATKSFSRGGLAAMAPRGGLVAFAAEAGERASDNPGGTNGLYTQHLLAALERPAVPANVMFSQVQRAVREASAGRQVPTYYDAGAGAFVFRVAAAADVGDVGELEARLRPPIRDVTQLDVAQLRPMAEQGDPRAQTELGERYENGRRLPQNYAEAVRLYRRAAEQGHAPGQVSLGAMYRDGRGLTQDDEEAVMWFRRASEQGLADGQYNLGRIFAAVTRNGWRGRTTYPRMGEAVQWLRRAAEQGHARAQAALGRILTRRTTLAGDGVTEDDEEAVMWYRRAAEQGLADGQYRLGEMYRFGDGVAEDDEEAVMWYRRAAEQGFGVAHSALGDMYMGGRGVPQDLEEAARWYLRAAQLQAYDYYRLRVLTQLDVDAVLRLAVQGYAHAQTELGERYREARGGVTQDYEIAVSWFRRGAEQGYAGAQAALGAMYRDGRGLTQDDEEAVTWFRRAAEQGYAEGEYSLNAQLNLGLIYENGRGVARDLEEAARYYERAGREGLANLRLVADQGIVRAQYALGEVYEDGKWGVTRDLKEAAKWYQLAADQGSIGARRRLERVVGRMNRNR